jgi:hypothetical protein
MRFLSMIRISENTGQVPSEQLMNDMGKLIDEMTREGTLIKTAGLMSITRVAYGQLMTTAPAATPASSERPTLTAPV